MSRIRAGLVSSVWVLLLFAAVFGVVLNVPSASGQLGIIYIRADGSIDPPTAPIRRDGDLYTLTGDIIYDIVFERDYHIGVWRDDIVIDGAGFTLQGPFQGCGIGIYLQNRNNVTIKNMGIKWFNDGIALSSSSNITVSKNKIIYCNNGIRTSYSSYNNIFGNNITNTIRLDSQSSNNRFYHNNLGSHPYIDSDGSPNIWDYGYPSGGNFWGDYDGTDADGDGIGDTPYIINANNTDRYPLMHPWASPESELAVSITAPASIMLGGSSSLDAIVTNEGQNDEVNVELSIHINGTIADSKTIRLLQAGNLYTLTYLWTPTDEGTYNVTAYVHPVSGETSTENNQQTKFVTVSTPPAPPEVQVGVKAGDWIKIDYTITGWPAGTPYPLWLKVEFLSVDGTNATARVTMRMSDGTEQDATVPVDVVAGGQALGLSGFLIPPDLRTGDSVFMTGYGNVTIAGETTRTYAGASRTVIYASFSQLGTQLTYYWDKQTGIMVEAFTTSGSIAATGKATETNMWQAQSLGLPFDQIYLYVLAAVIIAIAVGSIAFAMRRKKKPPEAVAPTASTLQTTLSM